MMLTTANGTSIHSIGIGTWNIASRTNPDIPQGRYRDVEAVKGNEDKEVEAIQYSIERGQNHVDCAELYGAFYTDEVVGKALRGQSFAIRESLFIADKLWKHSVLPAAVKPTVEQMLSKLGTHYLDLLYIHVPWPDVDWRLAIPQIDDLIDAGIVRHFGVSNFDIEKMREVQNIARHPIAANQVNFNCLNGYEIGNEFLRFCRQHDITVIAYRPIARGAVVWNETLGRIAKAHAVTPTQIALAWLLRCGALPIPKAIQKSHIDENLGALGISLSNEEIKRIIALRQTSYQSA